MAKIYHATMGESIPTADTMLDKIGGSTLSADRMLAPIGWNTLTADRMFATKNIPQH